MLIWKEVTQDQAAEAMRNGEFGEAVRSAGPEVAVILTQSWCPQWSHLEQGLRRMEGSGEAEDRTIHVFFLAYDETSYFHEFMMFKETVFGNYHVPYIRYYRHGAFVSQSNYVTPTGFLSRFEE